MYTKKRELKNTPIPSYYGLGTRVAERTGYARSVVCRALRGESDSLRAHEIRRVAKDLLRELQIEQ